MYVHERWLHACGLNERDDVSRIYICTRHFHPNDFGINNKRIRLHHGAIPSIAVPNPVIEENIVENNNVEVAASTFPMTLTSSITIDRMEVQLESQNSNIDTDEEQSIPQSSNTLQYNTPQKQRRFATPRYISEIELSDIATPRKAARMLMFMKETDKKSKKIKRLQQANIKLKKRVASMQQMMSHLHKKGLISKNAEETILVP
ncbi:hypothetical protein DMN91_002535 [Ooceraea biroi]|uniref:THAP-type domain-containing protein n=2 Tax=Ooceraea biroi TaxID=2015173 RepID=A0A3L8DVT2_OOCBI|nr:hypothetical protein DMN91_002535 [Ooceraea biroi]